MEIKYYNYPILKYLTIHFYNTKIYESKKNIYKPIFKTQTQPKL